ncbi:MAG: MmgE/PrpD family protein [Deltaproteobacteria bacterium]|nr:MmgE/PrpD family protein [Deltaproteobacteria bacterium]
MDAAYQFAETFSTIRYDDLPTDLVEVTKKEILDTMGVCLAGASEAGAKELRDIITDWGGKEESSILYWGNKVPAPNAAQVNATMIHTLDYDDVHDDAVMHPGVVAIPTCLAMGELRAGMSGKEFITATALGVDMICRFGLATRPGENIVATGWHLTTLYGYMTSAAVAGRLLGLNLEGIVDAMGIAYHRCSGNGQSTLDGGLTKRMGPGFAIYSGISSAIMASKGITGAKNPVEGKWGLYAIYHQGKYDPQRLTADLGKTFEGVNVSIKPYPCCRGNHVFIDATMELLSKNNIQKEDITKVKIFSGEGDYELLCVPFEIKGRPRNFVDAQFSIPYNVANVIVRGKTTREAFTNDAVKDPDILHILGKTEVELDPAMNGGGPHKNEPGKVQITTKQGNVYTNQVDYPFGSPQRPMSYDDCSKKFRDCATYPAERLTSGNIEKIVEIIEHLEEVEDVRNILGLLNIDNQK